MKRLLFCLLLAPLLPSCKKESEDTGSARIKTYTRSSSGTGNFTLTLHYNDNGKIAMITNTDNTRSEYTYSGNMVIQKNYSVSGALSDSMAYTIGSSGYIDTGVCRESGTWVRRSYKYDAEGRQVRYKLYDQSNNLWADVTYNFSNGNCISSVAKDAAGNVISTTNSTYDLSRTNTIGNENMGQAYFGRNGKNMVQSSTVQMVTGTHVFNYFVTYDDKNRVTSVVTKTPSGATVSTENYTYF